MIEHTPETAAYWAALAQGRLTAMQCISCGQIQPTPRSICRCGAREMHHIDLPGEATLVSYTVASYAPPDKPYLPSPYTLGIVSFAGLDHQMMALVDVPETLLKIGGVLTFEPFRHDDFVLPQFVPLQTERSHD